MNFNVCLNYLKTCKHVIWDLEIYEQLMLSSDPDKTANYTNKKYLSVCL